VNQDDPFAGSGDLDRTLLRPMPGGRRPPGASPPPPGPSPTPAPATPEASFRAAPIPRTGAGLNPLADAAAPLLDLVGQLRATVSHPDPTGLRDHLIQEVRTFEATARASGIPESVVLPARYALCSLLDESVLKTPWGSESVWSKQGLLISFHNEAYGGEKVFVLLERLMAYPAGNLDTLELLYLCLTLGFEGRYRVRDGGRDQLEELRERLYQMIRAHRGETERDLSPNWQGIVERRNPLIRHVPLWVLSAVAAVLLLGLFMAFSFFLNRASDPVYDALSNLDKGLPAVTAGPREPLPPVVEKPPERPPLPTEPPAPKPLTLRILLADDIKAGNLEVIDRPAGSSVVLKGDGLFASASATVKKDYIPVLTRIGKALAQLPGPVLVTGHTDSLPIHTLRFPSNWHLSKARAEDVAKLLGEVTGDPGRFKAAGRADSEPLVPDKPTDPRNRRVEVTLMKPAGAG
jgi:type VI secretion system protein ImpK